MRCGIVAAGESPRAEWRIAVLWRRISPISSGYACFALATYWGVKAAGARQLSGNVGCSCGALARSLVPAVFACISAATTETTTICQLILADIPCRTPQPCKTVEELGYPAVVKDVGNGMSARSPIVDVTHTSQCARVYGMFPLACRCGSRGSREAALDD